MAEDDELEQGQGEDAGHGPGVGRFLYRLALAGVGGVVLAQEELSGLFSRRAEREPSAEGEPLSADPQEEELPSQMEATVDRILHTLHLPSQGDVDELNRKLDALAARVESLRQAPG